MDYRITLYSGFRSAVGQRMPRLWHPGTYAVPKDMPVAVAEQAIAAGAGERVPQPKAKVELGRPAPSEFAEAMREIYERSSEPVPGVDDPVMAAKVEEEFLSVQGAAEADSAPDPADEATSEPEEDAEPPKRRRGRPRRRASSRTKALRGAPENKAAGARDDRADVG